jgi:hypothetical protein
MISTDTAAILETPPHGARGDLATGPEYPPHETRGVSPLSAAAEAAEFMALPERTRAEIERWRPRLESLGRPIQQSLAALARELGVSPSCARKRYDAWRTHGWRGLAGGARAKGALLGHARWSESGPAPEFAEWYRQLCLQNSRKNAPAYRKFVRLFHEGELIPGLEWATNRRRLPRGFSEENLRRFCPTTFERTAMSIGRKAASAFRPLVYTSRAGLQVGQQVMVDDMWHDFKVVMLGQREPMRLLELHALDVYSGCLFAHAVKPRLWDELAEKSVGLKQNEFLFFLLWLLCQHGYHPAGTAIIGERGTATLSAADAAVLHEVTGGLVTFDGGVVDRRAAFAGAFAGVAKGNFRIKAALESLGNLSHNEEADRLLFPGQTGSLARVNAPEELPARERHERFLLSACAGLPAEVREGIRHDFIEYHQSVLAVARVWERINRRTDHALEGFDEEGLTRVDWLSEHGLVSAADYAAAAPEKQLWIRQTHAPRARLMAPQEVWERGRPGLVRLRPEQAARVLARAHGHAATVGRDHLIAFESSEIAPGRLRYRADRWAPGDRFRVVVNPFHPEVAHLFDEHGAWCGCAPAWERAGRLDLDAQAERRREASEIEARLLGPVARAGARETQHRLENARSNAALIEGHRASAAAGEDDFDAAMERAAAEV